MVTNGVVVAVVMTKAVMVSVAEAMMVTVMIVKIVYTDGN